MVNESQRLQERRKNSSDLEIVVGMLRSLEERVDANIQESQEFRAQFEVMKPQLEEVLALLERSKGIIWFLRAVVYIVAPLGTAWLWLRNHVNIHL